MPSFPAFLGLCPGLDEYLNRYMANHNWQTRNVVQPSKNAVKRGKLSKLKVSVNDAPVDQEGKRRKEKKGKKKKKGKSKHDNHHQTEQSGLPISKLEGSMAPHLAAYHAKSCCYLCVQNSVAISGAMSKNVQPCTRSVQTVTEVSNKIVSSADKSCNPVPRVRTIQSSVKVNTHDVGITCSTVQLEHARKMGSKSTSKRRGILSRLEHIRCPADRTVMCQTERNAVQLTNVKCGTRKGRWV
ncbi:uncharacterized protein LOC105701126 [Orussus abietinus]|uniref:uncharacterized protein LOC105701126 n=1 Tax=Orussus abietinus TaxID=222816 RepID=UPI000C715AD8|nr:uncharacterized protein LOC105701126 [Orussus abietinus]